MKIFISWSGERSKTIAEAVRDWLRIVIPNCEPWLSKDDIRKGARWSAEPASMLQECQFGLICVTPDNIDRPWMLFEAGALSKTLSETYVCPLLFDLRPNEIVGPLEQFQAAVFDKADLKILVRNMNEAQKESALKDDVLDRLFELAWPDFERELATIPPVPASEKHTATTEEMVREILARIRADQREAETGESEYSKTLDSLLLLMVNLLGAGIPDANALPTQIAKDFENWDTNARAFLKRKDLSGCPDCAGTGWIVSDQDISAKRCTHDRLVNSKP